MKIKRKLLIPVLFSVLALASAVQAAGSQYYNGSVEVIELNTAMNNETMGFHIKLDETGDTRVFILPDAYWSDSMKKNALSLFLMSKSQTLKVRFFGNIDSTPMIYRELQLN